MIKLTIIFFICLVQVAFAQVSFVEGFSPLEGVITSKANQSQAVKPGAVFKDCDDCPAMVVISEDFKKMAFAIGIYEITQKQWVLLMGNNPSKNKGQELPVENISWDDATEFARKLSMKTGYKYRLPSEAEWDAAADINSSNQNVDHGWLGSNSDLQTHSVGLKKPNRYGLYDMVGNVWEWVQDCWNTCIYRKQKGGSYLSPVDANLRKTSFLYQNKKESTSGFRVARDL